MFHYRLSHYCLTAVTKVAMGIMLYVINTEYSYQFVCIMFLYH